MRLSKVIIEGFRCFKKKTEINIEKDFTSFVGTNSSGKSAAMAAINKVLSENTADRVIKISDFYIERTIDSEEPVEKSLTIEIQFIFDELENDHDNKDAVPLFFRHMMVSKPGETPYLRICLKSLLTKSANVEGSIDTEINYLDIDGKESGKALRKDLDNIRVLYIPAFRDIEKEIKFVSGSLIHRMLSLLNISKEKMEKITVNSKALNDELISEDGVQIINASLNNNWNGFNLDKRFREATLEFSQSEIVELLKKAYITFKPGVNLKDFSLSEFGDGSKSILYFTMVTSLIEIERKMVDKGYNTDIKLPVLTIVLAEELENHVAPHMFGQLINSIMGTAQQSNGQVIISTHSPAIINRIDPEQLRLFRITGFDSKVTKITVPKDEEDKFKFIKDDFRNNPYIYYSKLVIVVEGDSEQYVIPKFLKAYGIDFDKSFVTVLSLNSRYVLGAWKLLSDLEIPYVTYVDLDNGRSCGDYTKVAQIFKDLKAIGAIDDHELNSNEGKKKLFADGVIDEVSSYDASDTATFNTWINGLKGFDVFFSNPIDLDFMMLKAYKHLYLATLSKNEGPIVDKKLTVLDVEKNFDFSNPKYKEKVNVAVQHVLKEKNKGTKMFSEDDLRLMVWYDYFFLGQGKPISHFKALKDVNDEELIKYIPSPLLELVERVKSKCL